MESKPGVVLLRNWEDQLRDFLSDVESDVNDIHYGSTLSFHYKDWLTAVMLELGWKPGRKSKDHWERILEPSEPEPIWKEVARSVIEGMKLFRSPAGPCLFESEILSRLGAGGVLGVRSPSAVGVLELAMKSLGWSLYIAEGTHRRAWLCPRNLE